MSSLLNDLINKYIEDGRGFLFNNSNVPPKGIFLMGVSKSHELFKEWFEIKNKKLVVGPIGRQFNYLVYYDQIPKGLISFCSPLLSYSKFNEYFGFNNNEAVENSKLFLNNCLFFFIDIDDPNIWLEALKEVESRVFIDNKKKYSNELLGLVSFGVFLDQ